MNSKHKSEKNNMRSEYDLDYKKAVRGKYIDELRREGSNVIVLEPVIAKVFPDSASVNRALCSLIGDSKNN